MPARTPTRRSEPDERPQNAVAVFDPVTAGRDLTSAINSRKPQLASLLGVELDSERGRAILERFVTVALHAATSDPNLLRATKESLVEAIRDSAVLGLEPVGATGDGAIVVYDEKVKVERPGRNGGTIVVEERVPTAHFQPMYRGLLKLARRSNELVHVDAHVVYGGDGIVIDLGSNPAVSHAPILDGAQRGEPRGAYAVAETREGRRYVDWMTTADIEIVRRKSRAKDAMAWTDFWPEMARKTVLRRLMKRLPLETLAEHALRLENEAEERGVAPVAAIAETSDARARLRARFEPAKPELEAGETPAPAGETAPAGDGDPGPTEPASSTGAAAPVEEEVEGESREVEDQATTDAEDLCGKVSPYREREFCVLAGGHQGPHSDGGNGTWL